MLGKFMKQELSASYRYMDINVFEHDVKLDSALKFIPTTEMDNYYTKFNNMYYNVVKVF